MNEILLLIAGFIIGFWCGVGTMCLLIANRMGK